jgi:hypothetical protein
MLYVSNECDWKGTIKYGDFKNQIFLEVVA